MTPKQIGNALISLGWRIRNSGDLAKAIEDFQRGWNLGPALSIDGKAGPKTQQALEVSLKRLKAKQGTASEHYSFASFGCGCRGKYPDCRRIRVHRALLHALEVYRAKVGKPISIVSGYRCVRHNASVGGATSSQHVYGAAADVGYALTAPVVAKLRVFSGIGRAKSTGKVRHVDVRHVSGNNTTGGTPDQATGWVYAS